MHGREEQEYPEDLKEEYSRLCEWVVDLAHRYGSRIRIRVIDPQSLPGLWKSLRHGVRRYPTFIVEGQDKYTGWDKVTLETLLRARLAGSS